MRTNTFIFIICGLTVLTTSRIALTIWQKARVKTAKNLSAIFIGGLRIDALMLAILAGIPLLLSPWFGHIEMASKLNSAWLLIAWFFLIMLELSTPNFILEYDVRPNRLYIEYLKHPKEVLGMLWKGYRATVVVTVAATILIVWVGYYLFGRPVTNAKLPMQQQIIFTLVAAPLIFIAIRGTLQHRPINPSSVAFCGDSLVNSLPLNSLYNVLYAIYCIKNERSAFDVYGKLDHSEIVSTVNKCAGIETENQYIPSLHNHRASTQRNKAMNIVMVIQESMGAQYTQKLGGIGITPELDGLMSKGWNFTCAYATGTRSVRGLEALTTGFPPTISDAVLRLSGAQHNFFTLAHLLKPHGYVSRFLYGGEAHFDNMKGFFLSNGFNELHDIHTFKNPNFVGTWGASDEDMFNKLHELLSDKQEVPTFTVAFTVSNHSPWEFPAGRINTGNNPATEHNAVRYADWALGQFFEKAQKSGYWSNTIFLVVADHDSRSYGPFPVPVQHFHIPALILGADITPRNDNRIISQIDLAPTLLSLAGISDSHPMIGFDLTCSVAGRALMQYKDNYGYMKGNQLVVLQPEKPATQYVYNRPSSYEQVAVNEVLVKEALCHALWPTLMYKKRAYTLPGML